MARTTISVSVEDGFLTDLAVSLGYSIEIVDDTDPLGTLITNPQSDIDYIEQWLIDRFSLDYKIYAGAGALGAAPPTDLDITT